MLPTVFIKKHFQMWGTSCKAYWVTLWSLNSVSVPGLYRNHSERAEAETSALCFPGTLSLFSLHAHLLVPGSSAIHVAIYLAPEHQLPSAFPAIVHYLPGNFGINFYLFSKGLSSLSSTGTVSSIILLLRSDWSSRNYISCSAILHWLKALKKW